MEQKENGQREEDVRHNTICGSGLHQILVRKSEKQKMKIEKENEDDTTRTFCQNSPKFCAEVREAENEDGKRK